MKKHKALLEVERAGIIVASTASLAAAAGRSALLNLKQASSSGSSIIDAFLNKGNGAVFDVLGPSSCPVPHLRYVGELPHVNGNAPCS